MAEPTSRVRAARAGWRWVGRERPPWAEAPGPGQESVWDFPRPPRIEPVAERLVVLHAEHVVADTRAGVRVVETAGAPTYYFPPADVDASCLAEIPGRSLCEWKGVARSFDVVVAERRAGAAAWTYPDPFPEFAAIAGWLAFMPGRLDHCRIGGVDATPQPGGYYGGWVTPALAGPIKGGPGSESW